LLADDVSRVGARSNGPDQWTSVVSPMTMLLESESADATIDFRRSCLLSQGWWNRFRSMG
jgi:hypothetical protein